MRTNHLHLRSGLFLWPGRILLLCGILCAIPVLLGTACALADDAYGRIPADPAASARALATPAVTLAGPDTQSPDGPAPVTRNTSAGEYSAVLIVTVDRQSGGSERSGTVAAYRPGAVQVISGSTGALHTGAVLPPAEKAGMPVIEILGTNDTVLYAAPFGFQTLMTVPMPEPGSAADGVPAILPVDQQTVLVVPYPDGAEQIRIVDENGRVSGSSGIGEWVFQDGITPATGSGRGSRSQSGSLNVLILASGYSSASVGSFSSTAGQVKQKILATAPFSSYGSKVAVNIHADTADLGCYTGCASIDRLMCCDSSKVFAEAQTSGYAYDEIIVIHNTGTYAGGGGREGGTLAYKTNSYSSYCMVYDGSYTVPMALHEFGHSYGDLCDEYTYGSEGYSYYPCVNCRSACSIWSALTSTCTQSCDARPSYYRPDDSIMLDLSSSRVYNQPSIYADYTPDGLKKRTDFFTTVPVTAAFFGSPTNGPPPLAVNFTDQSTGSPTSWTWIFGDGSMSTEQNPVHTYTTAGLYSVSLTAANAAGGDIATRNSYILVAGVVPVADFRAVPRSGLRPLTVQFTDASTQSPTSWRWTFGDGSSVNATRQNPVHTFTKPGKYTVSLKAANAYGNATLSRARFITVRTTSKAGVYRPAEGRFLLRNASVTTSVTWGRSTDRPVTGDWNGDGLSDVGVFRPSAGRFILKNGSATTNVTWGRSTDIPVTGDWNGDGLYDVGIFRPADGRFLLKSGKMLKNISWGRNGDIPVTGDWNGDGLTDVGVYRSSEKKFILANGSGATNVSWGNGTDLPVTGDWNGDGLYDVGVFRPSVATFILKNASQRTTVLFGTTTDKPVTGMWF